MNTRLVTFCCVCLLLGINGDGLVVQNEVSSRSNRKVHSPAENEIIGPESGRGTRDEAFVGPPRPVPAKNFEQADIPALENEIPSAFSSPTKAIDHEEKRHLGQQRSARASKGEQDTNESGFLSEDRQRQLDGVANPFGSDTDSLLKGKEGGRKPRDLPRLFDPLKLLTWPELLFENVNSKDIALPLPGFLGQPFRKFIEFLRDKLTNRQGDMPADRPEDHLLLKRLFQRGKELMGSVSENE